MLIGIRGARMHSILQLAWWAPCAQPTCPIIETIALKRCQASAANELVSKTQAASENASHSVTFSQLSQFVASHGSGNAKRTT